MQLRGMAFPQKAPGLVACAIGCQLFGLAVYISVLSVLSCRAYRYTHECTMMRVDALVHFSAWVFTLVAGVLSASRNKPDLGVAGGLAGVGTWAVAKAFQYWGLAMTQASERTQYIPKNDFIRVVDGICWAAMAIAMALGARMAIGKNEAIAQKAPWAVAAALGCYFMQKAADTWYLVYVIASLPARSSPGAGYCFGFVLSGLSSFLGFVILVGVSAQMMSTGAKSTAGGPLFNSPGTGTTVASAPGPSMEISLEALDATRRWKWTPPPQVGESSPA